MLAAKGSKIKVMHPMELLVESYKTGAEEKK
jgi:hypothetical protein